jgi:thioredoxin 1
VLEFGTPWCGWCRAAQPLIAAALAEYPDVRHIKVEDGSGRPLGRAFGVKLWPTLIFLKRGRKWRVWCARTTPAASPARSRRSPLTAPERSSAPLERGARVLALRRRGDDHGVVPFRLRGLSISR